jgi:uncharacterized membrane protein
MTPTFDPIITWPALAALGAVLVGLTLWAYRRRLSGTSGTMRWVALGLRLAAVALCLFAALKPSLVMLRKVKQTTSLVFLVDGSSSMGITDEAGGRSRFEAARKALDDGRKALGKFGDKLQVKALAFDDRVRPFEDGATAPPRGPATALGTALDEAVKQSAGSKLMGVVLLSDGNSNAGPPPLQVAQRLKARGVPIVAVGYGSETAGASSRDLVARDLIAGPVVFVKNQPAIRGAVAVRGFPNQPVEVELYVEDDKIPVATKTVRTAQASAVVPLADLKWTPQRPGETKLTLRVKPKDGELVPTNNEVSTYVTVQSGGLAVLYLAGPGTVWEQKYLTRALDAAQEIQVTLRLLRRPATEDPSALPDEELTPGKYDVIVLGDVPANFLTPVQHRLLRRNVERGAGLMMLGGRSSFGSGGWSGTDLAALLPVEIGLADGQIEPPDGVRMVPVNTALENYLVRLGATAAESLRIWTEVLPPLPGANRLGAPKPSAIVLAQSPEGAPLFAAQDVPPGRVLAFAGETWPWARLSDDSQLAHRKFWRQSILWLAHKEDQGSSQVKLTLDRRRIALGQKLELAAIARDPKGEPIPGVKYATTVEPVKPAAEPATKAQDAAPERVDLFAQGNESRGQYFPTGKAGEFRVSTVATKDGKEIGRDSARFLVFQDDRELENPAADTALLRQLAELSGGKLLTTEKLPEFLRSLDADALSETVVQREVRLWDNWPFLLLFAGLLGAEWVVRKRLGWV